MLISNLIWTATKPFVAKSLFWSGLALTIIFLALTCAGHADDTLWSINFNNLKPGDTPRAESESTKAFQSITSTATDSLVVAPEFGALKDLPLLFKKTTKAAFSPCFQMLSPGVLSSGVLTFSWDMLVDKLTFNAKDSSGASLPVENIMGFCFMKSPGSSDYNDSIQSDAETTLSFGTLGGDGRYAFAPGQIVRVRVVLDLDKHTLQHFINDKALGSPIKDDSKFASFYGLRVSDGSTIGGNYGSTFTAAFDNILVRYHD